MMEQRLLMQFKNSPNLLAIVRALQSEIDELTAVFNDLNNKRWVATATGVQLDGCGEIVDQSRTISEAIAIPFFGFDDQTGCTGFDQARMRLEAESYRASSTLNDVEYRSAIYGKIAKNSTDGSVEDTLESIKLVFNSPALLSELGNANIAFSIGEQLTEEQILLADALNLFIKPAGVGIAFRSTYKEGATFGFYGYPQNYTGFGQGLMSKEF